jgi:hypothetical protein
MPDDNAARRPRRSLASVTLLIALGALGPAASSPAAASAVAPSPQVDAIPAVVDLPRTPVEEAVAFWTPERRALAERAGEPGPRSPWLTSSTSTRARGVDSATRPPVSTAVRISPPSHVGRLYVDVGAGYFTCSANAVASPNGMTVATAAHCTEGDDGPAKAMLFVPGYEDGRSPYGEWPVSSFITGPGWSERQDPRGDTAFLRVQSPTGRTLSATVGASPIEFDRPRTLETTIVGYPALPPYDASKAFLCRGRAEPQAYNGGQDVACTMNEGASGGPWFDGPDASAPQYSVSTNRFADSSRLISPVWGAGIRSVYAAIASS